MIDLTLDYRRTRVRQERELYRGADVVAFGLMGRYQRRKKVLEELTLAAETVQRRIDVLRALSDSKWRDAVAEERFKQRRFAQKTKVDVDEALALVAVAAERTLGLRPFHVQLMGALALARGFLAEMATGEGKTLTVALAAAVSGWSALPCHTITANDYLAARDAEWLRLFYKECGLTVSCVTSETEPPDRAKAYAADITYTTAKEALADFLRDRLELGTVRSPSRRLLQRLSHPGGARTHQNDRMVMRGLHSAIVDEADSIFIDEAVTPLIISMQAENEALADASRIAAQLAAGFQPGVDYEVDFKFRDVHLRHSVLERTARHGHHWPAVWRPTERRAELLRLALVAREFYRNGTQYVIQEGKVELVDEFTGRIMPHRTWQQGLQQAVEAKENLEISPSNETLASLSFQRFFRCYPRMAGVTGTAQESSEELWQIYHLAVVKIPTHRPCQRQLLPTRYFPGLEQKWSSVVEEIKKLHATDRPILVGTRSIGASEELSRRLTALGLQHRLLNASRHREEAEIVRLAGEAGRITIATNMAGRGTDIALGKEVPELGGLHVIATEMHESGRVDRQLVGRCARQGDPGVAQIFVSMEDDLVVRFLPAPIRHLLKDSLGKGREPSRLCGFWFRYAQRLAQRLAYRQRKQVLRMDRWLDDHLSFAGQGVGI